MQNQITITVSLSPEKQDDSFDYVKMLARTLSYDVEIKPVLIPLSNDSRILTFPFNTTLDTHTHTHNLRMCGHK